MNETWHELSYPSQATVIQRLGVEEKIHLQNLCAGLPKRVALASEVLQLCWPVQALSMILYLLLGAHIQHL